MTNTRKELESWVVAMNSPLRDVVSTMPPIILLRNAYPPYRADYAYRLYKEGVITKNEASEFINTL